MSFADIKSGHRVFIHGGVATPAKLIEMLVKEAPRLKDVEIMHLHTEAPPLYADPKFAKNFRLVNFFVGSNVRKLLNFENVDYLPSFLSDIPRILTHVRKPDVALIQVSPPDQHGFCTLGTSVDVARAAVDTAKIIIALVNKQMPRVHGDGFVHISRFSQIVEVDEPLPEHKGEPPSETDFQIAAHVANIIEDGSTLQLGIGAIPNAVASRLKDRRHLGIHTEMWSDGTLDLIESGAVDNSRKAVHAGKTVSSFVIGSKRLYRFLNDNPSAIQLGADYVNNPIIIMRNPKVVAINSAVEIDLTGQVCADSIGSRVISGVGGQMDFIRGAALSPGGKPVIALRSRTNKGASKIVPTLRVGAGVVTTRAHAYYVATEHGIVNLNGKTIGERAELLISISHPEDREDLSRRWFELKKHL